MKNKSTNAFDLNRFRTIVDAYGTDPSKWPEAEREAALALLTRSSEAEAILDQAASLDRILYRAPVIEPSPELKRVVAAIPERHPSMPTRPDFDNWKTMVPLAMLWKTAVAATLAVVLGIITGAATVQPVDMSNTSTSWDNFANLAFVPDLDQELSP